MNLPVALTVGDYNGIGPEVLLKALRRPSVSQLCTPVLIGPESVFAYYARKLHIRMRFRTIETPLSGEAFLRHIARKDSAVPVIQPASGPVHDVSPGEVDADAGRAAARAIEEATALALSGRVGAIVTAPISKLALHKAGVGFPGHTELLQHLTSSPSSAMMLVSRKMKVGLITIHVPLKDVSHTLTPSLLRERLLVIHEALVRMWGIRHPRLALLGLNPHAGESGDLGSEEREVIVPVMQELALGGMRLEGPFASDAFFGRYTPGMFDAVVAMYHDQGLIPLKMSSSHTGVNVTAGLPIVRTSPGHGTAFEIAGKGEADPRSMVEAVKLAVSLARNRAKFARRTR